MIKSSALRGMSVIHAMICAMTWEMRCAPARMNPRNMVIGMSWSMRMFEMSDAADMVPNTERSSGVTASCAESVVVRFSFQAKKPLVLN